MIEYTKPTMTKITVKRIIETYPDLSFLTQEYGDCSKRNAKKYKAQDAKRLADYNADKFFFMGIIAEAEFLVPEETIPPSFIRQELHSGGLWGIESDSGAEYIHEEELEQIENVKDIARKLNIDIPENVEIEYNNAEYE